MALEKVYPLVIKGEEGDIVDVSLMNEKAYSKSRERGVLWHLHRETGRILPYNESLEMESLKAGRTWYEAELKGETTAGGTEADRGDNISDFSQEPAALRFGPPRENSFGEKRKKDRETGRESANTKDSNISAFVRREGPNYDRQGDPETGCGATFEELERTVIDRKHTLPEGSYTTHLFNGGEDKIRKKTGEEAVELILAYEDERIVSEAADFIYHLMVLLAFRNIPFSALCGELAHRAEESRNNEV
ncbi:MAG: phosphoribosyl-ATP diphosphatase [Spirochaetia bacterium]